MIATFLIYKKFLLNSDLFLENTHYFLYSILLPVSFSLYIFYFKKNNFEIKEILYLIIMIFIFYFTSLVMYFSFNLLFFLYGNFCASDDVQFVFLNLLILMLWILQKFLD